MRLQSAAGHCPKQAGAASRSAVYLARSGRDAIDRRWPNEGALAAWPVKSVKVTCPLSPPPGQSDA
jgi:hypothetical protein